MAWAQQHRVIRKETNVKQSARLVFRSGRALSLAEGLPASVVLESATRRVQAHEVFTGVSRVGYLGPA